MPTPQMTEILLAGCTVCCHSVRSCARSPSLLCDGLHDPQISSPPDLPTLTGLVRFLQKSATWVMKRRQRQLTSTLESVHQVQRVM